MLFLEEDLLDLNEDKALDLDGFFMASWNFSLCFVKDMVIGFFKELLDGVSLKDVQMLLLVLIPKGWCGVLERLASHKLHQSCIS